MWPHECRYLFPFIFFYFLLKKKKTKQNLPDWFDPAIVLFLFLEEPFMLSLVAVPVYVPTNRTQGFPFLSILPSIYCFCCFDEKPFWQMCALTPHCALDSCMSLESGGEYLFAATLPGHLHVFWKNVYSRILCWGFNQPCGGFFFFFGCWVVWVIHIFWLLTLIRYKISSIFSTW